jgi:hypothetical protein
MFARERLPGLRAGLMNLPPWGSRGDVGRRRTRQASCRVDSRKLLGTSARSDSERKTLTRSLPVGEEKDADAGNGVADGLRQRWSRWHGKVREVGHLRATDLGELGLRTVSQRRTLTRPLPVGEEKDADAGNGVAVGMRQRWSRWRGKVREVGRLRAGVLGKVRSLPGLGEEGPHPASPQARGERIAFTSHAGGGRDVDRPR